MSLPLHLASNVSSKTFQLGVRETEFISMKVVVLPDFILCCFPFLTALDMYLPPKSSASTWFPEYRRVPCHLP